MQSINFEFLREAPLELAMFAGFAEHYAHTDPTGALSKLRSFAEQVVDGIYATYRLELKAVTFKPKHTGQLNFYLSAVASKVKGEQDNPSIGLLPCRTQNRVVAEYALRDAIKPMGVAEYQLKDLQTSLPSIEQIETELAQTGLPDTTE